MRACQVFIPAVVALGLIVSPVFCQNVNSSEIRTQLNGSAADFGAYRKQFHRTYEVSSEEFSRRHLSFQRATIRHTYLNSFSTETQSAKYGINQFSDLSQEEFRDLYLGAVYERAPLFSGLSVKELPDKFDWRDKAAVAPVQDQQACGSCWAFSVVGAIQSVHAIGGSRLEQLSVQQVVDCSYQNAGCNGGSTTRALNWLKQSSNVIIRTRCAVFFPSGQEKAMMGQLVQYGPLVAIVDAVSWQDYLGGIIQYHCSSQWSNHAVLIVGYDTTGDIPYWIVQNSWGTRWGNDGYVYIKIGGNVCGIADSVAAVFL
uniref:Cathepsin O n=2 Tax=Neolamprologus brichardi TaxID=32507 RepID=A0A3Q4H5C2_NEOBR